ncbi:putative monooxygenase, FAD-binding [Bradyrhizobium sp. ORS 285]|uniref:FAD-dependent oxidoreductase n=1 Tax=Bradyrhizobium sp. ORS 285 TaxID=115808 RepID=UPI0002408499|nr:FAD-dependent oxidoreductase [Bradyrhizobium sp. ORS 285]CCD88568.1 putative monooxygenase, FAD-binding [Bradyrhizobium sp. ORS 285]SMX58501.1 putative monooxygenase, FAD-binding [Bradyrhizobium sp. ORS 285]
MKTLQTQVLIVGAGPVGLTAAMDLASRGIYVVVAEIRRAGEPPNVKCNHVSARSMEVFRRLGIVREVREGGLPADFPNDCAYRTAVVGRELTRIPIPSRRDRYTATGGPDTDWPTPEPPHRINQIYLEPILFACAEAQPRIKILNRVQLDRFEQDDSGVIAHARDLDSDQDITISADYLIGCDGGRSTVRRLIGSRLGGTDVVQRVQSTYIHAPALKDLITQKPAWMTMSLNPRRCGTTVAIDGRDNWLIHNHLAAEEVEFDSVDRDWALRTILGVDDHFKYEIISKEDWIGRRLVADRFRDRRAFICGDAAHLWIPYAGYGMNAGIADAVDLCWMLAGVIHKWAAPALLDAYEAERQPITEQVSHFAMNHALAVISQRRSVPAEVEMDGPAGDAARSKVGQAAYDLNVQQYCCAGLNFGYYYDQSPAISYDGETPPPYGMGHFTASTVPGARAPHVWLADGRSLLDALGPAYTLVRFDPSVDASSMLKTAADQGVPLTLVDVDRAKAGYAFAENLLLLRPDSHIAWRGLTAPREPGQLFQRLRGIAKQPEGMRRDDAVLA